MRCMVGIPEEELTPPRRLLAESFCQHFMQLQTRDFWTSERLWQPKNPLRIEAPLDACIFDEEWMKTFGLSRGRWENDILVCSAALSRQERMPNRKGVNTSKTPDCCWRWRFTDFLTRGNSSQRQDSPVKFIHSTATPPQWGVAYHRPTSTRQPRKPPFTLPRNLPAGSISAFCLARTAMMLPINTGVFMPQAKPQSIQFAALSF